MKNIPKNMSEIKLKNTVEEDEADKEKEKKGKKGKKGKKSKKENAKEEDDNEISIKKTLKQKEELVESEEEKIDHKSPEIQQIIESVKEFIKEKGTDLKPQQLQEELRNQLISIGADQPLKYYIAFNSVFSIKILEEFGKYRSIFKNFVDADGESGVKHFVQSMVDFFINKYPKLEVAIPSFMKFVYDAEIVDEHVFLNWEAKKWKTDKKASFYSKKDEKSFRKKGAKFLTWLKEAEEAEGEEEEDEEEEESKKEMTEEELKAKKMKDLIEKEKLAQEKELAESKLRKEEEESKQKEISGTEKKIDVLQVKADQEDEDFDIDDI